jgi:hypothetical protein
MKTDDPLASWRRNPFFVLGVSPEATRMEIERAGQRLLGLLALGSATAARYDTPLGPATRDADAVREALAALRDPGQRVVCELLAELASPLRVQDGGAQAGAWHGAERAIGWNGPWPE